MKINELLPDFGIWASSEEQAVLDKLGTPVRVNSLTDREQVIVISLIRKGLVNRVGTTNPLVSKNEKYT